MYMCNDCGYIVCKEFCYTATVLNLGRNFEKRMYYVMLKPSVAIHLLRLSVAVHLSLAEFWDMSTMRP